MSKLLSILAYLFLAVSTCWAERIVFSSGQGSGEFDFMTYYKYSSVIDLTPEEALKINAIRPAVSYCNGKCYYYAKILNNRGKVIVSIRETVKAEDKYKSSYFKGKLPKLITLKAGQKYTVILGASTSKSVGISTCGNGCPNQSGPADAEVIYAASDGADHFDRGVIAFSLIGRK